ncbi:hypothetical protein SUGI_0512350 [Cryptomeria japonica]|uniref:uncharacterized protein LOC131060611 n=1 Tax=Cryptomeria japonica TaxID=3369 RepID=UPI002408A981|nr:uncharacterized protein LOC131060611 [Cryptomeria japonica]GLJ26503.1 hypothetical protein SUGI_0512350 [Cryptomeria japonica]
MAKQDNSKVSSLVSAPMAINPNPKQGSPPKRDAKNKTGNPKRFSEVKSFPSVAPGTPSADAAARQFPKSPLASMHKKNQVKGNEVNRLLVTINVLGSAGALRFLVRCDDPVQKVIEAALKSYAREGRLPVLGNNAKQFELYCANSDYGQALDPSQIIGTLATRNFLLCKKNESKLQQEEKKDKDSSSSPTRHHQKTNLWKNCLNTMRLIMSS